MGHSTCADQVADLRAFLQSMVAEGQGQAEGQAAGRPAARASTVELAVEPGELEAMSAARLKAYLRERGVPTEDCFERRDLLARALEPRM